MGLSTTKVCQLQRQPSSRTKSAKKWMEIGADTGEFKGRSFFTTPQLSQKHAREENFQHN